MSDVKDGSIQYLERKFAPEIEALRKERDELAFQLGQEVAARHEAEQRLKKVTEEVEWYRAELAKALDDR